MIRIAMTLALLFAFPEILMADTIYLKNGRTIQSPRVWECENQIKCLINGAEIGFPKEKIERIDREKTCNYTTDGFPVQFEYSIKYLGLQYENDNVLIEYEWEATVKPWEKTSRTVWADVKLDLFNRQDILVSTISFSVKNIQKGGKFSFGKETHLIQNGRFVIDGNISAKVRMENAHFPTEQEIRDSENAERLANDKELRLKRKRQIQENIKSLKLKYPSLPAEKISSLAYGEVWFGMSSNMARDALGPPDDINRTKTALGTREQWVYNGGYSNKYYYFINGVLETIQD